MEAIRDGNHVPVALGVSTDDATLTLPFKVDPATGKLQTSGTGGGGTGTVTQVNTGTGLTGGAITTTGTISLDSKLAPLDTLGTPGQGIRVNGAGTALEYFTLGGGTGTVTTVSVVSANGFSGSVATATTTPAITLTTTLTQGSIPFVGSTSNFSQDNSNLFWDNTNKFLGIGTTGATNLFYPLTVGNGNFNFINTTAGFAGSLNSFLEVTAQNTSSGALASSDFVASNNSSNNTINFTDMGITSSGFTDANFTLWGGANTGYLFNEGAQLTIATSRVGAPLVFGVGGTLAANENARLTATGFTIGLAGTTKGTLLLAGNTSGTTTLQPLAAASGVLTIPSATDTLIGKATTDTLTNKTYDTAGTGNVFRINGTGITAVTGTGSVALSTSPAFVTPVLGTPTSGNLVNCTGYAVANIANLGAGVATFLATPSSANLAAAVTDETGTGALVFATSPTFVTPVLGTPTSGTLTNATGLPISGLVSSTSTALGVGSIELGNASDTTLSRSAGGVLAVEGVVIPSISSTNTLTNKRITPRVVTVNAPGATPTTNTDNNDIAQFTGLATAITSMTTNLTGTPLDTDMCEFMFLDNGTARAITWGASFANGGLVNLPTTTVLNVMLRVLVQYQTQASLNKWVCIAVA